MTKEITLNNGEKVNIDTRFNIKKLIFINRDFNTDKLVKVTVGKDDSMDLDFVKIYESVYVAYRQANMNDYLSYDEFANLYDLDIEEAINIYAEMFLGANTKKGYEQKFEQETFTKKREATSNFRK